MFRHIPVSAFHRPSGSRIGVEKRFVRTFDAGYASANRSLRRALCPHIHRHCNELLRISCCQSRARARWYVPRYDTLRGVRGIVQPSPLSVDLRERDMSAVTAGASCHQAEARFGVSVSSVNRWSEQFRHQGRLALKPPGADHA